MIQILVPVPFLLTQSGEFRVSPSTNSLLSKAGRTSSPSHLSNYRPLESQALRLSRTHLLELAGPPAPGALSKRGAWVPSEGGKRGCDPQGLTVSAENFCAGAGGSNAASSGSQHSCGGSMVTLEGTKRGRRSKRCTLARGGDPVCERGRADGLARAAPRS